MNTLFSKAVCDNRYDECKRLIELGADVDVSPQYLSRVRSVKVLFLYMTHSKRTTYFECESLLQSFADGYIRLINLYPGLREALIARNEEKIISLRSYLCFEQFSLFHLACCLELFQVAEHVLDVDVRDKCGFTALHYAATSFDECVSTIHYLWTRGAKSVGDINDFCPLYCATNRNMRWLLWYDFELSDKVCCYLLYAFFVI